MNKDIAVIGLGIFGKAIALALEEKGYNVLAVDNNAEEINRIKNQLTGAVVADVTDEEMLTELAPQRFGTVILGLGDHFEELILGITYLKKMGVKQIIARANTEIQQEILLRIGADEVILPEKHSAEHLAERISVPNIIDFLELDEEMNLTEIRIKEDLAGQTLKELDLRRKYNITALVLKREGQKAQVISNPNFHLKTDDCLVVVGQQENISNFFS